MNYEEYTKKARCLYCERPIDIREPPVKHVQTPGLIKALPFSKPNKKSNQYRCECRMSKRIKFPNDGYTFTLPICNKYQIYINTMDPFFRVYHLECDDWSAKHPIVIYNVLVEIEDIPNFITLSRLKLIDRLEEFLTFI